MVGAARGEGGEAVAVRRERESDLLPSSASSRRELSSRPRARPRPGDAVPRLAPLEPFPIPLGAHLVASADHLQQEL